MSLSAWAQSESTHVRAGMETEVHEFDRIRIKNVQEESLGRIIDLDIDLINGRVVEMLMASDRPLDLDPAIALMSPHPLISDPPNDVCRLNVSVDVIKSAPVNDISKCFDSGRSDRLAVAYRILGQEPSFLEDTGSASRTVNRRKLLFESVARSSRIVRLLVWNLRNQQFGEVYAMTLDIPNARIRSFAILAPGNFDTRSVIPTMGLSFNATRRALVLDDSNAGYASGPR